MGEIQLETLSFKKNMLLFLPLLLVLIKISFLTLLKAQRIKTMLKSPYTRNFSRITISTTSITYAIKSTRETRSIMSNDYTAFLQDYEVDIEVMEDDQINFHQAMQSFNSQKSIVAMNEEMMSMKDKDMINFLIARRWKTHWLQMDIKRLSL